MAFIRLAICVIGVYSTFLLWAIAQERLSAPFPTYPPHSGSRQHGDKFPSTTFINVLQSLASCSSALTYLILKRIGSDSPKVEGHSKGVLRRFTSLVGWEAFRSKKKPVAPIPNGSENGEAHIMEEKPASGTISPRSSVRNRNQSLRKSLPVLLLQVSAFQTTAAPIGFASLRYISYPTMVLGKSCKLIPVLLLNVVLYRRKFKPYKYVVVGLVSVGISMFMLLSDSSQTKTKGLHGSSSYGLVLLGINLLIDGLTNSTQDEIFSLHPSFTGQQMMFTMSFLSLVITLPLLVLPPNLLPNLIQLVGSYLPFPIPSPLQPTASAFHDISPLAHSLIFIQTHPSCILPLLQFALLGGLGQLFIFETISHFGSLTLVMLTVTRKLFTMLLSVVLFEHKLTTGQWAGVAVVFGGIGVEAAMKRKEILDKQIASEHHKSRLKAL